MAGPLRIFIGYDSREPIAFSVLAHSILRRTDQPVSIHPLALNHLRRVYTREHGPTESTEFSLTRFLVPYLCDFKGTAIFMDCDMLCQVDIGDVMLHTLVNPNKAIYCCQHNYTPKGDLKFLGQQQTSYPRKNWSSFMVFNNELCTNLTPEYVNKATGLMLHRFWWTSDDKIGALPLEWNWLVGEYEPKPDANLLHYTLGGPWFDRSAQVDHADLWQQELEHLMGSAVAVRA